MIRALAFFAALSTVAAAAAADEKPAATKNRPDAWISAKSKIVLWTDNDVRGSAIDVDVKDGFVTLSGRVNDAASKAEAERRVKGLDGVKGVKSLLQVVSPAKQDEVKAEDKAVKEAVEAKLHADASLKGISVDNVTAGVVLLSGKGTLDEAVKAVQLARSVAGVKRVASTIHTPEA